MSRLENKGECKVRKEDLKVGQQVIYHPVGLAMQTTKGVIKEIIVEPEIVGNTQKKVQASEDQPRILIENLNTKKETAYKLENIERILDDGEEEEEGKDEGDQEEVEEEE
ncbi:hypothetical protein G9A89_017866 [Geosiphon pyriformis]|nr:hypothetical protein G9A89_017866 [Geosiphon pyriformis]